MKKLIFILTLAASVSVVTAQDKPVKKDCSNGSKKECVKKEGKSCCSPTSKVKAMMNAKPATEKKS